MPGEIDGQDQFGIDTVLAVRGPATVGTPSTTHWVVAATEFNAPVEWPYYDAMVFGVTDDPAADAVYGVPWGNILDGGDDPNVVYEVAD